MARTWLPALRARTKPARGQLDARVVTGPRGYVVPGQPYNSDWNTDRAVREGYQVNPWVFRCVEFISQNARGRTIVLREDDRHKGKIITPERLDRDQQQVLRVLNRKANEWEIAQIFRHRMIAQFLLSARGVYIDVVRSRRGGIHSLYLLDPDAVEPVPGLRKKDPNDPNEIGVITPIESFRITTTVAGAPYWDWRPPFDPNATPDEQPSGIVWLRSPHPTLFARGMSPMEAAGLSADLDRYARLYNRRFMMEDGRPGGVLLLKGPIDQVYEEMLLNRFNGGPDVSGARTIALDAEDGKWLDTSGSPRDTQWGDTMDRTKEEICGAFGLPQSVVTDSTDQTFDNSDSDYAKAWEHGMWPTLDLLDAQLDQITPGGLDDNTYLSHDVSDVWVLGRHKRALEDRAAADLDRGLRTIDEVREVYGLDPFDVPATRVLWIPAGRLAVGDGDAAHDGDQDAAGALPIGNGQDPTAAPPGAGVPGALPPGFGLDPAADLMQGEPAAIQGSPSQRALPRAGRTVPGAELTAAPETKTLKQEGEQRGARPAAR